MIQEITADEFDALDMSGSMMVEFYSKTCGPCKMLAFVLKDIDKTKPDFKIYTIDFDENAELKERLQVKGFPSMLFFKDGVEVSRLAGLKQKPVIVKEIEAIA
ncbi:thioredoxin family protein [Desulfobaculum bizertense]|uniref:Thioredoxin n=1 Tax=Desulfobaculum bizertense DSM 18034 TaxID=1121442 RepID=A0A1T4X435_9BACT|nr:thioredoxin family protein [Desulfobaculum bizertense]SKA84400.1 thioredoxin 1 [Desulfobaculum bizertense DSM 18034]